MNCETWQSQIDAYVDGELVPDEETGMASHLRACANCNAVAADAMHLKLGISAAGRRYRPSEDFRIRIGRSVQPPTRRSIFLRWAVVVTAAVAMLAFVFLVRARSGDPDRELLDAHLNVTASTNPVDVLSSDMHTVKPWFAGKVPFTFSVPELTNSPFNLVGGRVVYVRGTPCALLLFSYRLHRISTVIGPAAVLGAGDTHRALANGFHLVRNERRGYEFVTMGDAGMETVSDLADRIQKAQE